MAVEWDPWPRQPRKKKRSLKRLWSEAFSGLLRDALRVGDVSWFRNCCAFKSIQQVNYITQQYDLAIEQVVHIRGSTSNNDVVFLWVWLWELDLVFVCVCTVVFCHSFCPAQKPEKPAVIPLAPSQGDRRLISGLTVGCRPWPSSRTPRAC